jgi:Ca-activated chloride channel family protein
MSELLAAIGNALNAWERLRWNDLQFTELSTTMLLVAVLVAAPVLMLLARALRTEPRRRIRVALPAVLSIMRRSPLSPARHAAFVLFAAGIPFFAVAMADPRSGSVREEVVHSGRRIAILIDGSGSMVLPFESPKLNPALDRTFYTAVAASERFVRLRIAGKNADRIAIIEFGNEAYVVTPFTTDYDNAVLSLRLIGEPRAWNRFNVFGTTIVQGLEQGLQLFKTFNLLDGSDNMMVIFTDGNDGETTFRGRTLDEMMLEARKNGIPISMVRLGYGKRLGDVAYDGLWKAAVERSGGRFYVADDEEAILRAVSDIDRRAVGRIAERRYAAASPEFAGYALVAIALWLAAGTLKLTLPWFRTFP